MKFISQNGKEIEFYSSARIAKRSLSFVINDPNNWNEDQLLKIIWKISGNNCVLVKLGNIYRNDITKNISHRYDLEFITGFCLLLKTRKDVNDLMNLIEESISEKLDVKINGTHKIINKINRY